MLSSLPRLLYRVCASIIVLLVIFVLFCPLIIIAPTRALRREIGRACVRSALAAVLIPFRVRGLENLPEQPCVVVANHASYLDGLVLTAALPRRFTFLVQDGAANWPYAGLVIKRMGVRFVTRESARDSARQMRGLMRELKQGDSLAIFPEGTFQAQPGLMPFYKGAFMIAARVGVPVVPVVIHGTRRLFGDGDRLVRWSPVRIEILPPLTIDDKARDKAGDLSDRARLAILEKCNEPDLTQP